MHLEARPNVIGWWRLRYRFDGKEGMLSLGTYPDVPLTEARQSRDDVRRQVAAGIEAAGLPGLGTFEHVARGWHDYMAASWSTTHAVKVLAILENDLFPYIGRRPLREVTPPELLR